MLKKKLIRRSKETKPKEEGFNRFVEDRGGVTKYWPEMCDNVIELMSEKGMSRYEVARELGVTTSCFLKWIKEKKELREAVEIGEDAARGWWEGKAREYLINYKANTEKFNTQLWSFVMTNRFGYNTTVSKVDQTIREERKEDIPDGEKYTLEERTATVLRILRGAGYGSEKSEPDRITDSKND